MNKKSKLFTLLLSAVFTLGMPLTACSSFGQKESYVTLVDFANETETVGLGENYVLPSGVAFDENGNDYRVIYEVKDAKGEKVSVLNGRFKVKELGEAKYVITCYAEVETEKYLTRTITLNVVDRAAPTITTSTMPFAFVGEEYTISGVKISDNTGENVTPVYKVLDANDSEVAVQNGKFTPTTKGEYTLQINATDASGNKGEKDVPIYVREPMGDYVLENFNDEYGLPVFSVKKAMLTEDDVVYHETFDPTPDDTENGDDRVGVAEGKSTLSTSASYGAHYYFKFDDTFKDIGEFEYIYIKAYIKSSISEYKPKVTLYSKNEPLGVGSGVAYNVNEWVEIRLTKEDICAPDSTFADPNEMRDGETPIDCFFRKMTSESGYYLFYIPNHNYTMNGESVKDNANNYVLFVDEIGYQPVFNPTVEVEESYDLGETITLAPTVETAESEDEYSIDVKVTSPSGENVTLTDNKFRLVEAGEYTIELTYVSDKYNGYTMYKITAISTKEITIGEYTGTPTQYDTVTLPSAAIDGGTVSINVSLEGQDVAMASENTFVANCAGEYLITYSSEIDGLIYKKSFTVSVERAAMTSDEVISFASKEELTDNTIASGFETEWLYAFEGEYGVVKLSSNGNGSDWSYFAFKNMQAMSTYNGYEYMVVRIYIPSSVEYLSGGIALGNSAASVTTPTERDKWVNIVIPYDKFNAAWSVSDFNAYRKNIALDLIGDIYMAGAFMMNDVADLSLQAVITNLTNDGQAVVDGNSFSISLPSTAPNGATISVKDPDGNTINDLMNITAKYGDYTIVIACDGYFGAIQQTVSVEGTFAFALSGENSVSGNIVTLKSYQVNVGSTDVSEDAEVVINVTLKGYNEKIEVVNSTFTAPFTGAEYQIEYVVTYNGATYHYNDAVTVASAYTPAENEVISFAEPTQMAMTDKYDSEIEWLAQYQGKTGVAKFTAKNWGYFGFKTMQEMSAYADCDTLVVRMFIETADYSGTLWIGGANNCQTTVKAGEWVEYCFPGAIFKSNWANNASTYDIWSMALSVSKEGVFYIDEIFVAKSSSDEPESSVIEDVVPENAVSVLAVNYQSDVSAVVGTQDVASVEYLETFEGANGVAKVTGSGNWGRINLIPTGETATYANYKYLVVRMYIDAGTTPSLWLEPGGTAVYTMTTVETGKWVDYYFDGETFYNQLVIGWNNYFSSICTNKNGTYYIDQVYMTNVDPQ